MQAEDCQANQAEVRQDASSPVRELPSSPTPIRIHRATVEEVEDDDSPTRQNKPNDIGEEDEDGEASPFVDGSRKRPRSPSDDEADEEPANPFPVPPTRSRPSDYLRSRCPLCFGGSFPRVWFAG